LPAARRGEEGEPEDRQHERKLAAPLVGGRAREDAADQPHDEGDGAERAGQNGVDGEAFLDVDQDERQDGEIEAVERPSEEGTRECTPLLTCQVLIPGPVGGGWMVARDDDLVSHARGSLWIARSGDVRDGLCHRRMFYH
jgi:hypothetical protein